MGTIWVDKDYVGSPVDGGETTPFTTIAAASAAVAAGDLVNVKKAATDYGEDIDFNTPGTAALGINYQGYTTTPGDRGIVGVTGDDARPNIFTFPTGNRYSLFQNFHLKDGTDDLAEGTAADGLMFQNCLFTGAGAYGFKLDNNIAFSQCSFADNRNGPGDMDEICHMYMCKIDIAHVNGIANGVVCQDGAFVNCEWFNPKLTGAAYIQVNGVNGGLLVTGNTFHGIVSGSGHPNDVGAIYMLTSGQLGNNIIANNIFYTLDTAIRNVAAIHEQTRLTLSNLFDTVTTKHTSNTIRSEILDVDGLALFTDAGARDYTLLPTSAALDAGIDLDGTQDAP